MTRHPVDAFVFSQDDWECGRPGQPCRFGPTAAGRCPERAECRPERTGGRWACTRPIARGGPCEKGPLPDGSCCFPPDSCSPRTTVRRKLKTTWRSAGLLALGLGLVLFFTQLGVSPGPLTGPHAAFEDDCTQCHADVTHPTLAWAAATLQAGLAGGRTHLANSRQCMNCHQFGEASLLPHGVDLEVPAGNPAPRDRQWTAWERARTPALETRWAAELIEAFRPAGVRTEPMTEARIPCMACHRDHEGRDQAPAAMTDAQCQACHAYPFDGFSGHPPFSAYPHSARPRVAFDHHTHFGRHFAAAARDGVTPPESCGACHAADDRGTMEVQGFGTCAACHEKDITDPAGREPYLQVLAPPGLDLEALEDAEIGDWPLYAEAEINPFLRFLLTAGGRLEARDLEALAGLDLLDLADAGEAERAAVTRLAWAFKRLLGDLVQQGPAVLVEAADALPAGGLPAADRAALAGSLPFELIRQAADLWFPTLADELDRRGGGEELPTNAVETELYEPEGADSIDEWLRYGGWHLQELALLYRPTGHGDRFLHAWITAAAAPAGGALLAFLVDDDGPVVCGKCHASGPDQADTGRPPRVHWFARGSHEADLRPAPRPPGAREASTGTLTRTQPFPSGHLQRFSHRSHRQAIADTGCVACHRVVEAAGEARGPAGFAPVSQQTCTTCHSDDTTLAACGTCHTYHFDTADGTLMEAGGGFLARDPFGKPRPSSSP